MSVVCSSNVQHWLVLHVCVPDSEMGSVTIRDNNDSPQLNNDSPQVW